MDGVDKLAAHDRFGQGIDGRFGKAHRGGRPDMAGQVIADLAGKDLGVRVAVNLHFRQQGQRGRPDVEQGVEGRDRLPGAGEAQRVQQGHVLVLEVALHPRHASQGRVMEHHDLAGL